MMPFRQVAWRFLLHIRDLIKWLIISTIIGVIVGLIGTAFGLAMEYVTEYRMSHEWTIYLLPVLGLAIVWLYSISKQQKNRGTNLVLEAVSSNEEIPASTAPLIFISTVLTHFGGGSSGREGAALQLGGSIGTLLGKVFRLDEKDKKIIVMCGMSAAFAALFGTPMAAAIFSMEVISVGIMHYSALVPCVFSSIIGAGIASGLGLRAEAFPITQVPQMTIKVTALIIVLAVLCGFLSTVFCLLLHRSNHVYAKYIPNPYLRIGAAGLLIIGLTLLVGSRDYNGSGMQIIERSVMEGKVVPYAFLLKMLFTAVTLGAGFKGGEIVPSFFVGATFGCIFGQLTGLPPMLSAACGMLALFCGVINCPITSILIGLELFGMEGLVYYIMMVAISFVISGYSGLYNSQKFIYSKFKTEYINRKTIS